jgi:hypothetical protein
MCDKFLAIELPKNALSQRRSHKLNHFENLLNPGHLIMLVRVRGPSGQATLSGMNYISV